MLWLYIYWYYIILNIAQVVCQSWNPLAFIPNTSITYFNDITKKPQKQTDQNYYYHTEVWWDKMKLYQMGRK